MRAKVAVGVESFGIGIRSEDEGEERKKGEGGREEEKKERKKEMVTQFWS